MVFNALQINSYVFSEESGANAKKISVWSTKNQHTGICGVRTQRRSHHWPSSGRLWLNLIPLNLVRWIDSWPFDKTWKPGWIDSTRVNRFNSRAMNLEWIFIMTPSCAQESFSKASPSFFLYWLGRLRRGQIQWSSIISHISLLQKIQPNKIHSMNLLHF